MGTNRKRLLNDFATLPTLLGSEARVHSYHFMSSVLSFGSEDIEKRAPRGVHDALCKVMVFHHIGDLKVFNNDTLIPFSIRLSHLKMKVFSLTINLEMRFRHIASSFPASLAPLLAAAKLTLLAPERLLRRAIETGVVNGVTLAISQERLQPDINANRGMFARSVLSLRGHFTHDESVPMPIGPQNEMSRFRCSFKRSMKFDLDRTSQFGRDHEVFLVFMQIAILAILSELNRVPLIALFETRESHFQGKLFTGKKAFEGLTEPIGKHLYRCGWHRFTATPFEGSGQIILARKGLGDLVLPLDGLKHLVIELARLDQALHEQVLLFLIRIQAILKRFHAIYYTRLDDKMQGDSHSLPCLKAGALWLFMVEVIDHAI